MTDVKRRMPDRSRVRHALPVETGFTLIELLMATIILMVGIVVLAEMIPNSLRTDLNSRSNSIALIAAQRELEQMVKPSLSVQGAGGSCGAIAGHSYFCDSNGDSIGLGQTGSTSAPTQAGCPLDATGQQIDFSQPATNCNPVSGYTVTRQIPWNQAAGITQAVELRWRVVTMMNNGSPVRKFIIIGARAWQPGGLTLVTNLQAVVGRH